MVVGFMAGRGKRVLVIVPMQGTKKEELVHPELRFAYSGLWDHPPAGGFYMG